MFTVRGVGARRLRRGALGGAVSLAVAFAGACASAPRAGSPARGAGEADGVAVPAGEQAFLTAEARGTQNYECREKKDAPGEREWVLVAPEADLFDLDGNRVARHFAGPSWESTTDGSKVTGAAKARAASPDPDAIPWLRLAATSASGDGVFSKVKSIIRTDTHGGNPPTGPCEQGSTVKVPYSARYTFTR